MKKLSILIIALVAAATVAAQVKLDLVLNPTPPANLTEWGTRREVMTVIVSPGPGLALQFKIKAEIKASDGTVAATNDLSRAAIFSAGSAPLILTAMDVIPVEIMIFTGKYKSSLDRTGKLPSDNYTLCLLPVRPVDLTPLALQPVCKPFFLATTQLPILMKPYNEEILDGKKAQTAIIFRWTPVTPRTTDPVTYRIQVFEILEFQTPMQALRANQPLLDKDIMAATQYIWRPQLSFMAIFQDNNHQGEMPHHPHQRIINTGGDSTGAQKNINTSESGLGSGKDNKTALMPRFIWTIQTLDSHGDPVTRTDGNGEARSEPLMFFVDPLKNTPPKKGN